LALIKKLWSVFNVLKALNATDKILEVNEFENTLAYMFLIPIIWLCGLISFVVCFFILQYSLPVSLIHFGFFFISGLMVILIIMLKINVVLTTHLLSIWISLWFFISAIIYFQYVGPAVLTLGLILILLTVFRITNAMLLYVCASTTSLGIWLWIQYGGKNFFLDNLYFANQFIFYGILFLIAPIVHRINLNRFLGIQDKLKMITQQNHEMQILYHDLETNREALLTQNKEMETSNIQLKKNEELLNQLAFFDDLTKLPNRKMVLDRLNHLIHLDKENIIPFYLIFLDIDNFKRVNDTMGHRSGDVLLQRIVEILKSVLDPEDMLGRIGGDEFTIIIQRNLSEDQILFHADKIRGKLAAPILVDHVEIHSSASLGIAMFPRDGTEEIELMKCADTAMYKAKELGRNAVQFFKNSMKAEILKKISLEIQLRKAIINNLFWLAFQPQFFCDSRRLRGFEVLLRMEDKNLSPISPAIFIPVAEETGMIIQIGNWVIQEAFRSYQRIKKYLQQEIILSINISSRQLLYPDFPHIIRTTLKETGFDPRMVEFEITESIFIENMVIATAAVDELHNLGVRIALDDFGTGYSSLNYLRTLPIDVLKIDKSFVDNIAENSGNANLLHDIITLVHNLGISVVAEGVETESQMQYLITYSCDIIQGFFLGKPMREKELIEFIMGSV
jgi:diguanylate cyclase (GGDEF)-like protein